MTRVVCVLSGGSVKGAAHVGAIKALLEWELEPAHYVGTSIGAVMGACFASGLSYDEVLQRVSALSRSDVASLSPRALLGLFANHLFQPRVWRETIATLVPARSFEELKIPLTVTAVDAASGDLVLFGAGGRTHVPLVDALYASCALPLYFPPAKIGDREYVDGGLRAVLPLDVAERFDPEMLFAVHTGPVLYTSPPANERRPPGMIYGHRNAMRIMMGAQAEEMIGRWLRKPSSPLVLVQPRLRGRSTFAVERIVSYVERGYRAGHRALTDWESR